MFFSNISNLVGNLRSKLKTIISLVFVLLLVFSIYMFYQKTSVSNKNNALQKYKDELPELEIQAQNQPSNYEVNKRLAYTLYATNNTERAKSAYQHILNLNPNDSDAYEKLGNMARIDKNYTEAESYYQKAISADKNNLNAYINLALMYIYDMNSANKGLQVLNQAVSENPDNIDLKIMLAKTYQQLGDMQNARSIYEQILQKDPNNADAKSFLQK
ncbi:MAG: hypothetical protein KatS3mg090_0515 [Patescibacteria group bacterium]|nr:MAG: hypothetical protein KatS3mg090_0515 [Patescibacteria group bacterium]